MVTVYLWSSGTGNRDRRDQEFRYDTDTDTFSGSGSIPRLIPILEIGLNRDRYWYWYQENVPGLILIPRLYLIRDPFMSNKILSNGLNRDWYWYRDSNMSRIDTDTDTKSLGIGLFDTIPIFPSVSEMRHATNARGQRCQLFLASFVSVCFVMQYFLALDYTLKM